MKKSFILFLVLMLTFTFQNISAKELTAENGGDSKEFLEVDEKYPFEPTKQPEAGFLSTDISISLDGGKTYDSTAFDTPLLKENQTYDLRFSLKTDEIKKQLEEAIKKQLPPNSAAFYENITVENKRSEIFVDMLISSPIEDTLEVELQKEDGTEYEGIFTLEDKFTRFKITDKKHVESGTMFFGTPFPLSSEDYLTVLRFKLVMNKDFSNFKELYDSIMNEGDFQLVFKNIKAKSSFTKESFKGLATADYYTTVVERLKGLFEVETTALNQKQSFSFSWTNIQEVTGNIPDDLDNEGKYDFAAKKAYDHTKDVVDMPNSNILANTALSFLIKEEVKNNPVAPVQPIAPINVDNKEKTNPVLPSTGTSSVEMLFGTISLFAGIFYLVSKRK